jgi:hypothetical protein
MNVAAAAPPCAPREIQRAEGSVQKSGSLQWANVCIILLGRNGAENIRQHAAPYFFSFLHNSLWIILFILNQCGFLKLTAG